MRNYEINNGRTIPFDKILFTEKKEERKGQFQIYAYLSDTLRVPINELDYENYIKWLKANQEICERKYEMMNAVILKCSIDVSDCYNYKEFLNIINRDSLYLASED